MKNTQNLYLKTMYMLEVKYSKIRVTDIANELGYTKSSVSKALKRLVNSGLVNYEVYGDIILTDEARCIAEEIILKEDLLELFFVGILNIEEDVARSDVKLISEYVSDITKDKLREYIRKTLHLDNANCRCNMNSNPSCNGCETKKLIDRVEDNPKWIDLLEEDK